MPYIKKWSTNSGKGVKNVQKTSPRGLWMLPLLSAYFSSFRILNCHAFDSAEMKIGQMKKVPLGLWEVEQITGHIVRERILFFSVHHFKVEQLQKEQQISQTYQAFLRGSETRQEILHANISKTKFSFVISETNDCLATLLHSNISERTYSKIIEWYFHISIL